MLGGKQLFDRAMPGHRWGLFLSVISIHSSLRDYTVHIGPAGDFLKESLSQEHKIFLIDENVWQYHRHGILNKLPLRETVILPALEERKTLEGVQEIYEHILDRSAKRNMTLITIGGGILQDVTGFAASTIYRGVKWFFLPTTLLAQADSCIGGKTSLNYKGYKNLIGSFYPPAAVWVDPYFLGTLQTQDFFSGLGEVIKLHIMGGESKIQEILKEYNAICKRKIRTLKRAIQSSLEIKNEYIIDDEFDLGRRNMLNYGHCFGHALESVSNFRIPHGQAVVIGMMLANNIAGKRHLLSEKRRRFIEEELLIPTLQTEILPGHFQPDLVIKAMMKDKKRTGRGLVLVMINDADEMVRVDDLEKHEVREALEATGKKVIHQ
jgi:3-dehydroquinate synthase